MADQDAPGRDSSGRRRAATTSDESVGAVMRGMLRRDMERNEQLVGFVAAALAIGLGVAVALAPRNPTYHGVAQVPWARVAQPMVARGVILAATAVFAVVLWVASRHGSRVITAVVAMAGALFALSGVFGIPYIAYAGWLLIRNSRTMREQRAARMATGTSGSRAVSSRAAPRESASRRRRREEQHTPAPVRPDANKRYTPPRAQRRGGR